MKVEPVHPYRTEYSELTPEEYQTAKDWCVENGVAYEDNSGDDRTDMLRTVQATAEQTAALQALLGVTS